MTFILGFFVFMFLGISAFALFFHIVEKIESPREREMKRLLKQTDDYFNSDEYKHTQEIIKDIESRGTGDSEALNYYFKNKENK